MIVYGRREILDPQYLGPGAMDDVRCTSPADKKKKIQGVTGGALGGVGSLVAGGDGGLLIQGCVWSR